MATEVRYITHVSDYIEWTAQVGAMLRSLAEGEAITLSKTTFNITELCIPYFDHPEKDVNLGWCKEHGYALARVAACGGIVTFVKDMCGVMLNWHKGEAKLPDDPGDFYRIFIPKWAEAVSEKYGVKARYKPLQDLDVMGKDGEWRKCSLCGTASDPSGTVNSVQLTVNTIPNPTDLIEHGIKVFPEKFADKTEATATGLARATDLSAEIAAVLGRPLFYEESLKLTNEAIELTLDVICQEFDLKLVRGRLTEKELKYLDAMMKIMTSDEWTFERSERMKFGEVLPDVEFVEYRKKVMPPGGGGPAIRLDLLRKGDTIYDVLFTGTIHSGPCAMVPPYNSLIHELERKLKGVKIDEGLIGKKVTEAYAMPGRWIQNCPEEEMVKLIVEACQKPAQPRDW
jgi:lipoate-protein ligase A